MKLYEKLSADLDFNLMFSQHGHFTLAHSDRSLVVQNERAEVNKLLGIDSRVIDRDEVKKLCPQIHIGEDVTWPIQGALYHPPGGIIRHDAVVWGYAKQAGRRGIEIHQGVEVTGFDVRDGRVRGVRTNQGDISCGVVLSATAGWSTPVAAMAGVPLPITGSILQAFVTEPVKPFLDKIIVSAQMHIYCSQTDRGEFLIGAEVEPYPTYSNKGTFPFIEYACRHVLELFPQLHATKILRHWTGLCDMSPDYSPIMGLTEVDGFLVDCGWGTYGFKAAPITGVTLAELIATGKTPDADRAVQARALLHRQPRLRAGRCRGQPLTNPKGPEPMLSSLEIAQAAVMRPIADVAAEVGIEPDELELFGRYKAKVELSILDRLAGRARREADQRDGDHADAGRGGEDDDVGRRWRRASARSAGGRFSRLREPSLGPVFGVKGGAAGGGYAQVVPMEDINLHFTGDMHAITAANNLLSALVDAHRFHRHEPEIATVTWRRAIDVTDRQLRNIVGGLGGAKNGDPGRVGLRHHGRERGDGDPRAGDRPRRPAPQARRDHGRLHARRRAGDRRGRQGGRARWPCCSRTRSSRTSCRRSRGSSASCTRARSRTSRTATTRSSPTGSASSSASS